MKLFLMMSVLSQGVAQLYQHLNLTFREVAIYQEIFQCGHYLGHCEKKYTYKGKLNEANQCDLCYAWTDANCGGV